MKRTLTTKWVWYVVLAAVVTGLFAPTIAANALSERTVVRCPLPSQGDVLGS